LFSTIAACSVTDAFQANADPSVISLMARPNSQHLRNAALLNQIDEQGLRGMLAHLGAMQAQVKEMLMCRGDLPSPATPTVPEKRSRLSTAGHAFDALMADIPGDDRLEVTAANAGESKELPSPPATDLPDEKPQHDDTVHDTIAVATSSPAEIQEEDKVDVE
jgi:hypothetical protein